MDRRLELRRTQTALCAAIEVRFLIQTMQMSVSACSPRPLDEVFVVRQCSLARRSRQTQSCFDAMTE